MNFSESPALLIPFSDTEVELSGGWRYGSGDYHHALDYRRDDRDTFAIRAAADGVVIFQGWDQWSGNTAIVSHSANGVPDAFRTIYMHLRDGASDDCDRAWTESVPTLGDGDLVDFLNHLYATGCPELPSMRDLDESHWGTDDEVMPNLVGQAVTAGQFLAWAGNTGPGGKRGLGGPNTHLHLFVVRRDPTDNQFYFVDPYGIYGKPECYPGNLTDPITGSCARYPNLWKDAVPSYPPTGGCSAIAGASGLGRIGFCALALVIIGRLSPARRVFRRRQ